MVSPSRGDTTWTGSSSAGMSSRWTTGAGSSGMGAEAGSLSGSLTTGFLIVGSLATTRGTSEPTGAAGSSSGAATLWAGPGSVWSTGAVWLTRSGWVSGVSPLFSRAK